jgi:cell division protein FtsN
MDENRRNDEEHHLFEDFPKADSMFEEYDDNKGRKNSNRSGKREKSNSSLRVLKIVSIIFILLLTTAICVYLLVTYIQNSSIFENSKDLTASIDKSGDEIVISEKMDLVNGQNTHTESNLTEEKTLQTYENNQPVALAENNQTTDSNLAPPDTGTNKEQDKNSSAKETTTKAGQSSSSSSETQSKENKTSNKSTTTEKNSSTSTTTKKSSAKTYTVQLASFKDFDKAIALKNKMTSYGFDAYIVIGEVNGTYYYRVRIGKFSQKDEAINLINKIIKIDPTLKPIIIEN